ncbi:MAG: nucleoside triphosphate pyrophosphohydrolase [Nitrospirota bacterium]|nr:nucleoside triphosphate pyrophosphohydrolase [Nitrospirota bacterium]
MKKPPEAGPSHRPAAEAVARLLAMVETLRGPDGCPWDRAQTRESVSPFLVEETYEVMDAIRHGDAAELREELGDLLFQVLFHADMSREAGDFDLAHVADDMYAKMVLRHPHVFGDEVAETPEAVLDNWERVKNREPSKQKRTSVLDGVPRSFPALLRAWKVSKKAAREGFDWNDHAEVWPKVYEELDELKEAIASGDMAAAQDELGDVLFSLVNLGRKLDLSAEEALTGTIERFSSRFRSMEKTAGRPLTQLSPAEWETLWQHAKGGG